MTDKTRQDSGSTHIIRYALELGLLWIDGDGRNKVREALDALDILEAQLEAVGAGGVQALSAAPAGFVPVAAFDRLHAHAESLAARLLAASPTPPAEQQATTTEAALEGVYAELAGKEVPSYSDDALFMVRASEMRDFADRTHALRMEQAAPKAEPGDALDEVMRERDEAEDFINELLDEVLGADRPEWSSAYNRYDAMSDVRERITALHKPAVDKAWGQFQSAMAAPQQGAQEPATVPRFNCWSTNEGDSWFDHPADSQAIYDCLGNDAKVGDEYELTAGWKSVTARYRITEVVGDGEEYEVECVSHPRENTAPQQAPAPLSDDVVKDAARYRWLIDQHWIQTEVDWRLISTDQDSTIKQLDAAIDAALAAQRGK